MSNSNNENVKMVGSLPEGSKLEFDTTSFSSIGKISLTTNKELAMMIKSKLQKEFHDLVGVMIRYINNKFTCEFVFQDNTHPVPDGKIKNVVNLTHAPRNNDSFYDAQRAITFAASGNYLSLNDETKMLLAEFMNGGKDANHYNNEKKWNSNIIVVNNKPVGNMFALPFATYRGFDTSVRVVNIDLYRILRSSLGFGDVMVKETKVNENGDVVNVETKARYEMRYRKPVFGNNDVFFMSIEQFDANAIEEQAIKENPYMNQSPTGISWF